MMIDGDDDENLRGENMSSSHKFWSITPIFLAGKYENDDDDDDDDDENIRGENVLSSQLHNAILRPNDTKHVRIATKALCEMWDSNPLPIACGSYALTHRATPNAVVSEDKGTIDLCLRDSDIIKKM